MNLNLLQTAERVSATDVSDNFVFQRSKLAYIQAAKIVSGNVLEIGTGSGYGIEIISPKADRFITVDKFRYQKADKLPENVLSIRMEVPKLYGIPTNSIDFVIIFQVIEHIEEDFELVDEINRVLKPGGKLLISTPNKKMSLTRNPWHIREYTATELEVLLRHKFDRITKLGVYGNEKIMRYYKENKKSVENISRYDVFSLWDRLPRKLLQIPYDILNRMNRKKLLKDNYQLTSQIKLDDYYLQKAEDDCFDLYYIAEKMA